MRLFGFRLPFFVAVVWVAIGSTVWALGQHQQGRDGLCHDLGHESDGPNDVCG